MSNIPFDQEIYRRLAPREIQIVKAAAQGLTIKETADQFGIAKNTVQVHRARVISKLSCKNMAGAVKMLTDGGII